MAAVNKAIIIGYLGKDPEIRYTPDGLAIANFSVATTESYKDRDGNKKENTEWHRIVYYGKIAEVAEKYLKKGSKCYVEGKIRTRKWTDKDGIDRYTTEIVGERLQMLDSKPASSDDNEGYSGSSRGRRDDHTPPPQSPSSMGVGDFDDDIPF